MDNELESDRADITELKRVVRLLIAGLHTRSRSSLCWSDIEEARVLQVDRELEAEFAKDFISTGEEI